MTVSAPRLRSCAFALLAAIGLLLGTTAPAGAHAALTHSTPEQGAVTARPPTRVVLVFSEKIALKSDAIRVLDPTGKRVDDAHPAAQGGTAYAVRLPGTPAHGTYTVSYHVVSADSHPVAGAYTFSVGAPSTTSVSAAGTGSADSGPVAHAYLAGRFGAYAGLLLLVGGACFLLVCWPLGLSRRLLRRAVITGWALVTAGTAALLLLRGAYTGSGRFGEVADLSRLAEVAQTRAGVMLWARLVLLTGCAAAWASWRGSRPLPAGRRRALLTTAAAAVSAALATTWAAAEHASVGLQSAVAVPVDVVHLLAAAVWLGGVTLLTLALFTSPELPARSVARFSRLAFTGITVLVATGLYQSWRQVGTLTALTDTRYGHLLTAKVAAVGLLLGLAFFSRRLTGRLAQAPAAPRTTTALARMASAVPARAGASRRATSQENPPTPSVTKPGRSALRRWVAAETLIGVCVLAITAVLTSTEPARTQESITAAGPAAAAAPPAVELPFDTHGTGGRGTVAAVVDPGRSGTNAVHMSVTRRGGGMLDVPEVQVALTLKAQGIGPLREPVRRLSEGCWTTSGFHVPVSGTWDLAVTVRTSEIDQTTVRARVRIG
ncbi:copper resistance CopC/CopD family protein [Streptomyces sp. NPDC008238]